MRLGGALVLGALITVGCTHNSSNGGSGGAGSGAGGGDVDAGSGTVIIQAGGQTTRVHVEVVSTPERVSRGLMFRKKLGAHEGMLFIFGEERIQSFWMKNTYIPLDMIFINKQLEVVGVVQNAEPLTTTSRRVARPSTYVLEVNGGFTGQRGIGAGARVRFEGFEVP